MSRWYIKSRAEFQEVLVQTLGQARRRHAASTLWVHARIAVQLEAMQGWTADGRAPTADERRRIDIGLIAIRELDEEQSDEEAQFMECLLQLAGYFKEWPDDPPGTPAACAMAAPLPPETLLAGLRLIAERRITLMASSMHLAPEEASPSALRAALLADVAVSRLPGLPDELNPLVLDLGRVEAFVAGLPRLPPTHLHRLEGRFLPLHGERLRLSASSPVEGDVIAAGFELELPDEDGLVVQPTLRAPARRAFAEEVAERAKRALGGLDEEVRALEGAGATGAALANARWRRFATAVVWRSATSALAELDSQFRPAARVAAGAAARCVTPPWVGMPRS